MAPVICSLREKGGEVHVLSTGQHRDMVRQSLSLFGIQIDHDLDVMQDGQTLGSLTGRLFSHLDQYIAEQKPDMLVVQGDTTSVFAAAVSGFYRSVMVAHVEAGLRSFDLQGPFPEEFNRLIASKVSTLHFAPTERAKENLIAEGICASKIIVTGNTCIDALMRLEKDIQPKAPTTGRTLLVTAHRRENFGRPLAEICSALKCLHEAYEDLHIIFPVHPNPNVKIVVHHALAGLARVNLVEPVDYAGMIALMKGASIILTDSGGIQEEAPALRRPVLVLRKETERPEAIEAGVSKLVGTEKSNVIAEVSRLLDDRSLYAKMASGASPYGDGRAAPRIAQACMSALA